MSPEEFIFTFLDDQEPTYFDGNDRPKVTKALRTLANRIPADVELPDIIIFAPLPAPDIYACVLPYIPRGMGEDVCFMYFAPAVEDMEQDDADYTVAHEFAHASLRHHQYEHMVLFDDEAKKPYLELTNEVEADKLAVAWGFTIPAHRRSESLPKT